MRTFGYQLYSSRNFPPLPDTLRMLSDLGYGQVEGYSALFQSDVAVAALSEGLSASGLSMPTAHFGFDVVSETPGKVIEVARRFGIETVFVPAIGPEERNKDAGAWAQFGRDLAEAGKPLQDAGLNFGWHNHDFELVDLGGVDKPLDLILQGSDDLKFEIDLAWIQVGGDDPLDWIARYSDRIVAAHIKDLAPAGENTDEDGWADVGHGVMDWTALVPALDAAGSVHLIMEHDNPADHSRFAKRSLEFAKGF